MIDNQQMRALAYLASRCRPYGSTPWDEPGIVAALAKVAHLSLPDVALATIRAATNPRAETPGVIPVLKGDHWRDSTDGTPKRRQPPTRTQECPHHPGQYADNCGGCRVDDATGTPRPQRQREARDDVTERGMAECRAALAAIKGAAR